jgi:transposase-like protein
MSSGRRVSAMKDSTNWDQRMATVAAWRASGQTVAEYCERHGVKPSELRYWVKGAPRSVATTAAPVRFARVERAVAESPPVSPPAAIVIEVGAARVRVERGIDARTLAIVLEVLGASASR